MKYIELHVSGIRTTVLLIGVRTELVCFLQKTVGSHFWLRSHFSGNLVTAV